MAWTYVVVYKLGPSTSLRQLPLGSEVDTSPWGCAGFGLRGQGTWCCVILEAPFRSCSLWLVLLGCRLWKSEAPCKKSDHPEMAVLERPGVGTWVNSPTELPANSQHQLPPLEWLTLGAPAQLKPKDGWSPVWLVTPVLANKDCPEKHVLNSWFTKTWAEENGCLSPWDLGWLLCSNSNWNSIHGGFLPESISISVAAKRQL